VQTALLSALQCENPEQKAQKKNRLGLLAPLFEESCIAAHGKPLFPIEVKREILPSAFFRALALLRQIILPRVFLDHAASGELRDAASSSRGEVQDGIAVAAKEKHVSISIHSHH
jgi:hypothetical protein